MPLSVIPSSSLPDDIRSRLMKDEIVYHFGFIDAKGGGCGSTKTAKQWILVTNQRILYEAAVKEGVGSEKKYVQSSGSIPMSKVAHVGTSSSTNIEGCGCSGATKVSNLVIGSGGGSINVAIPTQNEAARIHSVIDEIISTKS